MKKIIILLVLGVFILYTILSLFVEIPKVFNNIFFAIVTLFAIYFAVFYSDLGKGIKDRFKENSDKMNTDKSDN